MNSLIDSFIEYNRKNYSFTEFELAKLKYVIQTILSETSKFLIMLVFFAVIGRFAEFAIATVVLLSVRSYAGGLHFNSYGACFLFTFFFYVAVIVLSEAFKVSYLFIIMIMVAALGINMAFAPIVSKNRPPSSKTRLLRGKIISCIVIVLLAIYLMLNRDGLYNNYIMWTVALQCLQLAVAFAFDFIHKPGSALDL